MTTIEIITAELIELNRKHTEFSTKWTAKRQELMGAWLQFSDNLKPITYAATMSNMIVKIQELDEEVATLSAILKDIDLEITAKKEQKSLISC